MKLAWALALPLLGKLTDPSGGSCPTSMPGAGSVTATSQVISRAKQEKAGTE